MSILQFAPVAHLVSGQQTIARGTEIDSIPVDGTSCRFQTCYDVDVYPVSLEDVTLERQGSGSLLRLAFRCQPGVSLDAFELDVIRLYFHEETLLNPTLSQTLYLWCRQYLSGIMVHTQDVNSHEVDFALPPVAIQPGGLAEHEGLLPYLPTTFIGYRLIQEYFSLSQKFLFVDLQGLGRLHEVEGGQAFEVRLAFSQALAGTVRISPGNILLYCTPVVNLFKKDADPIRLEHDKVEYRVRPAGQNPTHFEAYAIERVAGWVQGSGERREYAPFLSLDHMQQDEGRQSVCYHTRLVPAVVGRGVDTYMSFLTREAAHVLPPTETISLELTCTNRDLPDELKVGDIATPTGSSPEFIRFRNITPVTSSVPPKLDRGLYWALISNMSLNYLSLTNIDALRVILTTYNFHIREDRQAARAHELRMQGIESIQVQPVDRLIRGTPIRGLRIALDMRESCFAGEGDLYLLATVLNEFFSLYATVNSFHQLVVQNVDRGEVYTWPVMKGRQELL
jgi:type VI secretion system protein ImpG